MIPYLATAKTEGNKGIGKEMLLKTIKDAKVEEKNLDTVLMETGKQEEKFLNEAGLKRLYIESAKGELEEVPYYQSILADDWDKKTGKPKPGKEAVPNHLMIGLLDREGNEITTEELTQKVRAILDYNNYQTPDYFQGSKKGRKKAFQKHEDIINKDLGALEAFLRNAKDGKIKLLSAEDRKQHTDKIIEHTKAD